MLRSLCIFHDIAIIDIGHGKYAIIDADAVDLVGDYNWHFSRSRRGIGYVSRSQRATGQPCKVRLHRIVLGADLLEVDHISGDTLDNRRSNLRPATHAENMRNTKLRRDNTAGFKGVHLCRRTGRWRAALIKDGRRINLGRFDTAEQAGAAYATAASKHHAEFVRTCPQVGGAA